MEVCKECFIFKGIYSNVENEEPLRPTPHNHNLKTVQEHLNRDTSRHAAVKMFNNARLSISAE